MKKSLLIIAIITTLLLTISCGPDELKDGTFTGEVKGEGSSKMVVEIVIKEGKIVACTQKSYDKDGKVKDMSYGEDSGEANYALAQKAFHGMQKYPEMLLEVQNIDDVQAVSGATISHKEFKAAVGEALKNAKK